MISIFRPVPDLVDRLVGTGYSHLVIPSMPLKQWVNLHGYQPCVSPEKASQPLLLVHETKSSPSL